MVWQRRFEDYSSEECVTFRRSLRKTLERQGVDSNSVSYVDSTLRRMEDHRAGPRDCLTRDQLVYFTQIPALRHYPNLLRGLNRYLSRKSRLGLSCSDDVPVEYITILDRDHAEIVGFYHPRPPIISSLELSRSVNDENRWERMLFECDSNPSWASCLLELLQWEREFRGDNKSYKRIVSRRQLSISKRLSRIPPSMHLSEIGILSDQRATNASKGYGDIYQGVAGDKRLCLKLIRVDSLYNRTTVMKSILREVIPWSRMNHPNIIPFCGVTDQIPDWKNQIALVSPWMDNGNITQYLHRNPRQNRLRCVQDIIEGLRALHSSEPPIFHRDIKTANILVADDGVCCLGDFGLASISGSQRVESKSKGPVGTIRYHAPEVIQSSRQGAPTEPAVAAASDMWALGCVIYEIYTGHRPYAAYPADGAVIRAIAIKKELPGELPPYLPPFVRDFVYHCWTREPLFRPKLTDPQLPHRYPGLLPYY